MTQMVVTKDNIEIKLSDKIKKILKTKKWTQSRLALFLKISPARLNTYYKDRNQPAVDWLAEQIDQLYQECL